MADGAYYTPISVDGQVVRKHIETVDVSNDEGPSLSVAYTISNPYPHPIVVPIQSGVGVLYEVEAEIHTDADAPARRQELHVVPATVQEPGGRLIYAADEAGTAFGTTGIQRIQLASGIPNYRQPLTVTRLLVPGDSISLRATARLPGQVKRMILVDAMVGEARPYGVYPHQFNASSPAAPAALRLFSGAEFTPEPRVRMRFPSGSHRTYLARLFETPLAKRLNAAFAVPGVLMTLGVMATVVLLALSMVVRLIVLGVMDPLPLYAGELALFVLFGLGTLRGIRAARWGFAAALLASAALSIADVAIAIARSAASTSILLTELAVIPTIYLGAAGVIALSRTIRHHANAPLVTRRTNRKQT